MFYETIGMLQRKSIQVMFCISSKLLLAILLLMITALVQSLTLVQAFRVSFTRTTTFNRVDVKTSLQKNDHNSDRIEAKNETASKSTEERPSFKAKIIEEVAAVFGKRKEYMKSLLNDFFLGTSDTNDISAYENIEETIIVDLNKSHNGTSFHPEGNSTGMTHFAFLVHGYNGNPTDLLYLRTAMAANAEKALVRNESEESEEYDGGENSTIEQNQDRIVIHSCQSNIRCTEDGIEKGGKRILNEVLSIIRRYTPMRHDKSGDEEFVDVTISFVGNSLGGLYSRYAIAELYKLSRSETNEPNSNFILLEENIRLHLNIFCSTATPHLGVSGHLWLPLPRRLEVAIANLFGQTGQDIFRLSDLVKRMCTCPSYLKPLGLFRKRIAYANAYHTDFVVPTSTAAFLNPDSTYPHHATVSKPKDANKLGSESRGNDDDLESTRMVVATYNTPQGKHSVQKSSSGDKSEGRKNEFSSASNNNYYQQQKNEQLEMSNSLDSLGWKKVIVDVREIMPMLKIPNIPNMVRRRSGLESSNSTLSESDHIAESRDVASAYSIPDDVFAFPLGHNTMVAAENYKLSTVFQGGRPIMDGLAKEIIEEIFAFDIK